MDYSDFDLSVLKCNMRFYKTSVVIWYNKRNAYIFYLVSRCKFLPSSSFSVVVLDLAEVPVFS